MTEPCCKDIRQAVEDRLVMFHDHLGTVLLAHTDAQGKSKKEPDLIPINVCPWCSTEQPKKLYKSPAMNYRP